MYSAVLFGLVDTLHKHGESYSLIHLLPTLTPDSVLGGLGFGEKGLQEVALSLQLFDRIP